MLCPAYFISVTARRRLGVYEDKNVLETTHPTLPLREGAKKHVITRSIRL